jgi:hypothetical protein
MGNFDFDGGGPRAATVRPERASSDKQILTNMMQGKLEDNYERLEGRTDGNQRTYITLMRRRSLSNTSSSLHAVGHQGTRRVRSSTEGGGCWNAAPIRSFRFIRNCSKRDVVNLFSIGCRS